MSQILFLKGPIDKSFLGKPLGLVSPSFGPQGKMPTPPLLSAPLSSLPGQGKPERFARDADDVRRSVHDAVGIDLATEREGNIAAYEKARAMASVKPLTDMPDEEEGLPDKSIDRSKKDQTNRYKMRRLGTGVTFSQKKIFGSFEREVRKLRFKYRDTFKNMSKENWGQLEAIIVPHATKRRTGSGYTLFDRRRMKREAWQLYRAYKISKADWKDFTKIIDGLE